MMGPNHPETQFAIANLAGVLAAQKRYMEAERLYREALEGEIKALGDNHPEIANAWYNLATVEAAQGKRAKALVDLHKAIDHGYNDPDEIAQEPSWKAMGGDADYREAFEVIKSHNGKNSGK